MPELNTMEDCVTQGSRVFMKVEKLLEDVRENLAKLEPVYKRANELGMMGALKTLELQSEWKAAQGHAAQAAYIVALAHRKATDIAIENGVDQVTGADGGVVVLGGGGR